MKDLEALCQKRPQKVLAAAGKTLPAAPQ